MTEMLRAPPGVASSISRSSFRDTRAADHFSPFNSVHEFNAATRQIAPSPFLRGVRPGSLHTSVANGGTPMQQRGIDQRLSRRDSMASFYMEAQPGGRHPHPDDIFPDDQASMQHSRGPPSRIGSPLGQMHTMNVHAATPHHEPIQLRDDQNSVRYGSLYAPPPDSAVHMAPIVGHKQSFQTTGTKLSRKTKASKRSGLSLLGRAQPPPSAPSTDAQSQSHWQGTPYLHPRAHPSISEQPSRTPSVMSHNRSISMPPQGTPYIPPRTRTPSYLEPSFDANQLHRSMSVKSRGRESMYSIPKVSKDGFPFETEGDDLIARVWLPWTDELNRHECKFFVRGINGERYDLVVDYLWSKMIHGTAKFHNAGMKRRDGMGRGRLIVEWEIGFQFET